jgi:predicted nucleotidyltransferase
VGTSWWWRRSWAAGTASEESDIDVYVVTEEDDYLAFFADRVVVLVDKRGLLDGVEFPLL